MDDRERAAIRTTRDKFIADRQKLDTMIALLSEQLGEPVPQGVGDGGATSFVAGSGNHGGGGGGNPVTGTHEGEYFGFTSTKAAGEVLKKFGSRQHPLKTKDIYNAIKKGGVDISTEDSLYRSLARSRHFRKVARGTWGLSEWYPNQRTKTARSADDDDVTSTGDELDGDLSEEDEVDTEVDTS